jgi:hypothetical protein
LDESELSDGKFRKEKKDITTTSAIRYVEIVIY